MHPAPDRCLDRNELHDGRRTAASETDSPAAPAPRRLARFGLALLALAIVAGCTTTADTGRRPGMATGAVATAPEVEERPGHGDAESTEVPDPPFRRLEGVFTTVELEHGGGVARWLAEVPGIQDIRIPSSVDGEPQPVLSLPPAGPADQPLLVVLHSWSSGYDQHANIPFGRWAAQEGWAMVHPHFRGSFDGPEATGSELAVADVLDAIDHAITAGGVDTGRVYVVGYSGGGMMALLMAGRHPERFAGAAAWTPIHDLGDWYAATRGNGARYLEHIVASCGGNPLDDPAAAEACRQRSPSAHLAAAREAEVPVYIAHGIDDPLVPPAHATRAFDALADPRDRFDEADHQRAAVGQLPVNEPGADRQTDPSVHLFDLLDPAVHLTRSSGSARLVLFDGGHDMVFHPALRWFHALAHDSAS